MKIPRVSVVIPTSSRPALLPRAVDSALAGMDASEVEVVVVPNGGDVSWQASLASFRDHPCVRILPIEPGHANVARNHGLAHARGKYVRFLDDDDVLYKEGVRKQLMTMEQTQADICSGDVDMADRSGVIFGDWRQDEKTDDFVASSCSHRRMLQMTAHIFLKAAVVHVPWDESVPYSQDICWILDLIGKRELNWVKVESKVGCWHRHVGARISVNAPVHHRRQLIAERLRSVALRLDHDSRLTPDRRQAIADGIWEQVHEAFCYAPRYWWSIGKWAGTFSPGSHPSSRVYESASARKLFLDPLIWEAITSPRRLVRHSLKSISCKLGFANRW